MLACAAALLATGASAQTLEKIWEKNSGVPGSAGGGDLRFMTCDKDGKILVTDKGAKKIMTFNALWGAQDYLDIAPIIDEHYGEDVTTKEISKIDTTVVAEGDSIFDTTWVDVTNRVAPAAGTLIASDDAGNILINTGFPNASSGTDFIIISADLKNSYKLQLTMPEGVTAARCDQMGRIVGNMLSDEGAYMWICCNGATNVAIVKVVNGVQDMDYSQASTKCAVAINTSCVAQPVYTTVAEIDALMDELADLTPSFWFRNRSYPQNVYQWNEDGTEQTAITLTEATESAQSKNASQEGFEVFTLQGETYFVIPMTTDGTTNGRGSNWGIYRASDQKLVATWEENPQAGKGQGMGGFYVTPNDETSVYIAHFIAGTVVGNYLFTAPKAEEPAPALYIFGSFNSWTPAEGLELTYADGVYTIEDVEFGEGGNFGLSTVKSDNWDEVNANRYGFATDNAKAVVGENEIVKGAGAIQVPYAGVWDITVDIANLKLTLATETPEPTPGPEPVVIPEGLNKVWEVTTGVPGSASGGEFRFATARDGKILVTDKANKKIMAIDENGMAAEAIFDLAAAIDTHYGADVEVEKEVDTDVIEKIDTIVSETNDSTFDTTYVKETVKEIVHQVPGAATGITVDDAGNILVGTDFPNAGSSTDLIIISSDLKNSYKLQLTLPEGVAAGRIDQYGHVVGDMLSEEGAYLWLAINGQTKVAVVKIANGEQVVDDYTVASENVSVSMNTSVLAQPAMWSVADIDALIDEEANPSKSFWSRNRGSAQSIYGWNEDGTEQVVLSLTETGANGETTKGAGAEGFATFNLKGVTYFVVPMSLDGSARSAAIGVYDETGKLHATYTPEGVATGMGQMGSIIVAPINEEAVEIYRFIPGVIAAKYTFGLEKEAAPLYLIGDVNGTSWSTSASLPMTYADGVYTIENVEVNDANAGYGYFSFVTAQGDDWGTVNASVRYGAQTSDEAIATDVATAMSENWNAWMIAAGTYNITVDLTAMTVTVSKGSGVEGIEGAENAPAVYYNLQGVKVVNPENGVFIKVQGNKASKVLVK